MSFQKCAKQKPKLYKTGNMKGFINIVLIAGLNLIWVNPAFSQSQKGVVSANELEIAYESFGPLNGEAVVLIQGTGSQLTLWPKEFVEELAGHGYRIIRFDNRDVGLSTKLDSLGEPDWASIIPKAGTCDTTVVPYSLQDMADDVIGLMDALGIEKANVAGVSMGGAIAQIVASSYPERTLSLIPMMTSSGNPDLPPGDPEVLQIMATPPPDTDDIGILTDHLSGIYKAMSSPGYPTDDAELRKMAKLNIERAWYPEGTARHVAAIIMDCDRREELKKLDMPVVVIHGKADPVVDIEAGRELAGIIPNAKLVTFPGMAHDLPAPLIPGISQAFLDVLEQ